MFVDVHWMLGVDARSDFRWFSFCLHWMFAVGVSHVRLDVRSGCSLNVRSVSPFRMFADFRWMSGGWAGWMFAGCSDWMFGRMFDFSFLFTLDVRCERCGCSLGCSVWVFAHSARVGCSWMFAGCSIFASGGKSFEGGQPNPATHAKSQSSKQPMSGHRRGQNCREPSLTSHARAWRAHHSLLGSF